MPAVSGIHAGSRDLDVDGLAVAFDVDVSPRQLPFSPRAASIAASSP